MRWSIFSFLGLESIHLLQHHATVWFLAKVMAQNLRVFVMHYVAGWKIRNMFEAVALNR